MMSSDCQKWVGPAFYTDLLLNFPTVANAGLGLPIAVIPLWALRRWRIAAPLSKRHLNYSTTGHVYVQETLQVINVVYGRSQRLYLTESFVLELLGEMLPETRITFVNATHPLPLPLVSFANERGLEGIVIHTEMSVKGEIGELSGESRTMNWVQASCIQVKWRQSQCVLALRRVVLHGEAERQGSDIWHSFVKLLSMLKHFSKKGRIDWYCRLLRNRFRLLGCQNSSSPSDNSSMSITSYLLLHYHLSCVKGFSRFGKRPSWTSTMSEPVY